MWAHVKEIRRFAEANGIPAVHSKEGQPWSARAPWSPRGVPKERAQAAVRW